MNEPFRCPEARDRLMLHAAGELDPAEAAALQAHIARCSPCAAEWIRRRDFVQELHDHVRRIAPPEGLERRALARAKARRPIRLALPLSAAAALTIAALALFSAPPGEAKAGVLWASADAVWKETRGGRIELTRGEVRTRALEVHTPAAVAAGPNSEFFIRLEGDEPMRSAVFVTVLSGMLHLSNPHGQVALSRGESGTARQGSAPMKQAEDLARRFAKYYEPVKVRVQPKVPAYALPLDLSKIANYEDVARKLGLKDEESLRKNGFVVLPGIATNEDIIKPYQDLKDREVPIFVTADTLLHLYHVQFDETLKDIEEREFYKDILALTEALLGKLGQAGDAGEARRKAVTYLAIALKALRPDAPLPALADPKDVAVVLEKMEKHEGFWPDPRAAERDWPLFKYSEDFSQYVPRGHYTRSEALKRYFTGMMWYGRLTFILKGGEPHGIAGEPYLVTQQESDRQMLAAAMITRAVYDTELPDKRRAKDVWERIYAVTGFYVGLADDLGLQETHAALAKICGAAADLSALSDPRKMLAFKLDLAKHRPPAIYSGTGAQETDLLLSSPEDLYKALNKSMGVRFMGQRFIPDSYILGRLVFPTVRPTDPDRVAAFTQFGGMRVIPRGLDVAALLGSRRARELLAELRDDAYPGYDEALEKLQKEFGALGDADWNRNLYWSWLHALKPLLADYGNGYPTFMTTEAWRTKSLNTALASWAQLRHDTILYAKQSYTMFGRGGAPLQSKPVQGYVEPIPEFYARLLALARMTTCGLGEMKVLDEAATKRLSALEKLLERLLGIAEKELNHEELAETDHEFIRNFGKQLQQAAVIDPETDEAMKTTLIADVHTDPNTKQVLEEGTGPVGLAVICYLQPDGRLVLGAGPVLSYYEFKHPMQDRLTDEKWRELLKTGAVSEPEWTKLYTSDLIK